MTSTTSLDVLRICGRRQALREHIRDRKREQRRTLDEIIRLAEWLKEIELELAKSEVELEAL